MAKKRRWKKHRKKLRQTTTSQNQKECGHPSHTGEFLSMSTQEPCIPVPNLIDLMLDLWRIQNRVERENASEPTKIACERAMYRLRTLGFRIETLEGEPYDERTKVRVVEHQGGGINRQITECLLPAIYYQDMLVKWADVIVRGNEDEQTDS